MGLIFCDLYVFSKITLPRGYKFDWFDFSFARPCRRNIRFSEFWFLKCRITARLAYGRVRVLAQTRVWLAIFVIDKGLSRYSDCSFCICSFLLHPSVVERAINLVVGHLVQMDSFFWVYNQVIYHSTPQEL